MTEATKEDNRLILLGARLELLCQRRLIICSRKLNYNWHNSRNKDVVDRLLQETVRESKRGQDVSGNK